jgi:hypothetical protein
MRWQFTQLIFALTLACQAYAHGEEFLVPVYSQAATSVAIAAVLFLTPKLRRHLKAAIVVTNQK